MSLICISRLLKKDCFYKIKRQLCNLIGLRNDSKDEIVSLKLQENETDFQTRLKFEDEAAEMNDIPEMSN